ncbi:response regulator [Maritalea mobilis]|uniref:response regulator n=1 Tax=Maritalea mobilis TaxID=483324 RepID=UPI001C955B89|nr:response regulator [Maritalea mobilis]MBY6201417.1 response regulator [Maritalea mobilis]
MAEELKRILHVDDDEDIRAIVQLALEVVDSFELLQCASGKEALEKASEFRPQLILLDVMMPCMSGQTLASELAKEEPLQHVPVVFVTAKAEAEFTEQLLAEGATAVITKPFDPMTLGSEIKSIWDESKR